MKILFLDVDGVLNRTGTRERSCHGTYGVEPEKVAMVHEIVDKTGCSIVVSSTWRKFEDLYTELLSSFPQVIGKTPVLPRPAIRGDEIAMFIDELGGDHTIAILDDDRDMGRLVNRLVRTRGDTGLTHELKDQVIELLS